MGRTITLDMNSTTVKRDIAAIPEKLLEGVEQAIMEAAHLMVGLAQVHVRVDTGSLRDSIRVERGGQGLHWRQVRVRAGGYIVNPKTDKLVHYATIVEFKYPYMRPAFEEVRPQIVDIINRICLDEVSKLPSVST